MVYWFAVYCLLVYCHWINTVNMACRRKRFLSVVADIVRPLLALLVRLRIDELSMCTE